VVFIDVGCVVFVSRLDHLDSRVLDVHSREGGTSRVESSRLVWLRGCVVADSKAEFDELDWMSRTRSRSHSYWRSST